VLDEVSTSRRIERRFEVPPDLVFLDGHFEGFPVVAGVVQLRWVSAAIAALLGEAICPTDVEALKFPEPLLPGGHASLEVELADSGEFVRFRVFEGERTFASGRWRLSTGGSA
jgi:3-hydroxyacyl-[acyl-carrier-protein] dehydratase